LHHQLQRLRQAQIEVANLPSHFALARGSYVCLIGRTETEPPGFGEMGSVCRLTDEGLAVLLWEGDSAYFVHKSSRQLASAEDLAGYATFVQDLKTALRVRLE